MKRQQGKRTPYDRCDRVSDLIFQVISEVCYQQIEDPRIKGIQITGVKVTRDLQIAKVYYFHSGNADARKHCLAGLHDAMGALRYALSQTMTTKFLPNIHFYFDESVERGERVDALLNSLHQPSTTKDDDH